MNSTLCNFKIAPLLALLSIGSVYAADLACDNAVDVAIKHFKLKDMFVNGRELNLNRVVSHDCKPWLAQKDTLLLSLIHVLPRDPSSSDKQVAVAMINTKTRRVISSYRDALRHDGTICTPTWRIALDTAKYQLTPHVRAFGYRITNPGSCPSCNQADDRLTLLVREGKKLRPVLSSLAMLRDRTLDGCKGFQTSPQSYMEVGFLTLGIEKSSNHGYADLLLKTEISYATNGSYTGNHVFPEPKPAYYTLRYDGKRYRAEEESRPWWVLMDSQKK